MIPQEQLRKEYARRQQETRTSDLYLGTTIWEAPKDFRGGRYDYFYNFFRAIRNNTWAIQDPTFGLRAAGDAILANESYFKGKPVQWDPALMKMM